jgi:hypothetical protein
MALLLLGAPQATIRDPSIAVMHHELFRKFGPALVRGGLESNFALVFSAEFDDGVSQAQADTAGPPPFDCPELLRFPTMAIEAGDSQSGPSLQMTVV